MIWTITPNPAWDITYDLRQPLQAGAVQRALAVHARAGGKGNNVARTVVALGGLPVVAVEPLGGVVGHAIECSLENHGIRVMKEEVNEDNRVCTTFVYETEVTEVRAPGPRMTNEVLNTLIRRLMEQVRPEDWVVISGSTPPGLDPSIIGDWIRNLKPRVFGVVADVSPDALGPAIDAGVTAVVPNEDEFEGIKELPRNVFKHTNLIVTRGGAGVTWLQTDGTTRDFPASSVKVVNPVGAGDAFLGGLVHALARGLEWEYAILWAIAVAGASTETIAVADLDPNRANDLWYDMTKQK
ncbi:hypothetical protein JZ785_20190 [Alicyclobacillus curvatus]|nr:hypothetical protein JZ785_20190 [Alicyclobacillus curvatus]